LFSQFRATCAELCQNIRAHSSQLINLRTSEHTAHSPDVAPNDYHLLPAPKQSGHKVYRTTRRK
jgi:hypothetical protein